MAILYVINQLLSIYLSLELNAPHHRPLAGLPISAISFTLETLCLDLLSQDVLEGDSIGCELGDAFTELLYCHLFLVEVESETRLVVDVRLLRDVEA